MASDRICKSNPVLNPIVVPPENPENNKIDESLIFKPLTKGQLDVIQQTLNQLLSGSKALPDGACQLSHPVEHETSCKKDGITFREQYEITGTRIPNAGNILYVAGNVFEDPAICHTFQVYKIPFDPQHPTQTNLENASVASTESWCTHTATQSVYAVTTHTDSKSSTAEKTK